MLAHPHFNAALCMLNLSFCSESSVCLAILNNLTAVAVFLLVPRNVYKII